MPRRKPRYEETKWEHDPARWRGFMEKEKGIVKRDTLQPKGGWLLYRLDTLEDIDQQENPARCSTS